jgi:hypothetical protein
MAENFCNVFMLRNRSIARLVAGRKHRAEAIPPMARRRMADVYAAFGQEILDVSKRKRIFYVHQHRDADPFGRASADAKAD